jgi:hypothetical protein
MGLERQESGVHSAAGACPLLWAVAGVSFIVGPDEGGLRWVETKRRLYKRFPSTSQQNFELAFNEIFPSSIQKQRSEYFQRK